ncbi:MAG: leucyl/phenylalanyl-tRNA--protein transferase [Sphingopyxis sp.]
MTPLTPQPQQPPIAPEILLRAYASGIFPMADSRDDPEIYWVEPEMRAILPLDRFHLSRSLAKLVRQNRFRVTSDTVFTEIVSHCAAPSPGREGSWINATIEANYAALFALGHAHSVECWDGEALVGGLYGVTLGHAFFGESMFSRRDNASKVALAWLVARLRAGGFTLLDCQFQTAHLASLGAQEMPQADYLKLLYRAVSAGGVAAGGSAAGAAVGAVPAGAGDWGALDAVLAAPALAAGRGPDTDAAEPSGTATSPGHVMVQLLTNTS